MGKMKLGTKIIAGFIVVTAITLALGAIGYYGAAKSERMMNEVGNLRLPGIESLLIIKAKAENIRGTMRTLAIPGMSRELRDRQYGNMAGARTEYGEAWKKFESLPHSAEEEKLWRQFGSAWEAWAAVNNQALELSRRFDAKGIGNPAELSQNIEKFTKDHYILVQRVLHLLFTDNAWFEGGDDHTACNAGKWFPDFKTESKDFLNILREFSGHHQKFHEAAGKIKNLAKGGDVQAARSTYGKEMIPAMEAVFKSFEAMEATSRQSAAMMAEVQNLLLGPATEKQRIAIGHLDQLVELNRRYSAEAVLAASSDAVFLRMFSLIAAIVGVILGISLAILIAGSITKPVNRIVDALAAGAEQVSSASGQVSASSQSLAEGASEQAAAIEQTSSSLEEMSSMTRQNAENAAQANKLMNESRNTVAKAGASMKQVNEAMGEIASSGKEIGKIIKTIDEISFQTNLLALNAAVEAARAGEAGAGFAVVADEVRNLAQRAADAAKNTANLIEGTIAKIKQGTDLVRTTDEAFVDVAASANKVAELVGEIAAASAEQAQGIEQVNQAVTQMDQVTQRTAAGAEESASASEELNAQAESMLDVVNELMTLVGGASAADAKGAGFQSNAPVGAVRPALPMPGVVRRRGSGLRAGRSAEEAIPMEENFDNM